MRGSAPLAKNTGPARPAIHGAPELGVTTRRELAEISVRIHPGNVETAGKHEKSKPVWELKLIAVVYNGREELRLNKFPAGDGCYFYSSKH